jgi:hypothetical protein
MLPTVAARTGGVGSLQLVALLLSGGMDLSNLSDSGDHKKAMLASAAKDQQDVMDRYAKTLTRRPLRLTKSTSYQTWRRPIVDLDLAHCGPRQQTFQRWLTLAARVSGQDYSGSDINPNTYDTFSAALVATRTSPLTRWLAPTNIDPSKDISGSRTASEEAEDTSAASSTHQTPPEHHRSCKENLSFC